MGERKPVNKYIPADFDPALIPRGKKLSAKDGTVPVRMMLPFSMQCSTCNTFLYKGRKYNSKKENMQGPDGRYMGIQRYRFYIKCNHCSRPITFSTDPKNTDYELESGATRNFEIKKSNLQKEEEMEQEKDQEEKEDPMKALENRVLDSQREMADLDNLEEIKAMNARHLRIDPLAALQLEPIQDDDKNDLLTQEDEALIQSIKFGSKPKDTDEPAIKRLTEEDEARLDQERLARQQQQQQQQTLETDQKKKKNSLLPVQFKVKKRKPVANSGTGSTAQSSAEANKKAKPAVEDSKKETEGGGLSSLLGGYGSSSESD